ncbi:MAG: T9SS type A sorting domain-containing protein, partial [Bacteroidales bacterium]|nr:T9SS type A sorting domain-containing protein [Bacteroidales bacterium]
ETAQEGPYPKDLWMSETYIGYSDWNSAMSTAGAMHGALWAGNISLWTNWSFENMQFTKNQPTSTFYTSKNYFKYIRPGAVRVGTSTDHADILATAFEHKENGTFTVVLINKGKYPVSVELSGNNLPNGFRLYRTSEYENFLELDSVAGEMFVLPESSVTTLYAVEIPLLTMDDVDNIILRQNDPEVVKTLYGISDGKGGTASLTIQAESTDPALISGLAVTEIQADGTSQLSFIPGTDLSGTALVTVTLTDGEEVKEVKFYVDVEPTVGAREHDIHSLKVYPNPASSMLFIEIPEGGLEELVVTDLTGRILVNRKLETGNLATLNLDSFGKGIYIITARNSRQRYYERFVVE